MAQVWSFTFTISRSDEQSRRVLFRMDWLDPLAVQGTLKTLLQHHSSKASIFLFSSFFIIQLSQPYMTTGKTIALTRLTFVGKVRSLFFSIVSRFVIPLLSRLATALSWQRGLHNSMTLWAMLCRTTEDRQVTVESSDKTWSTGGGDSKPLQYSCCENTMTVW